jgi:thioredoxin 1
MTLAMLGAAALLALWMIMREGLQMSKGQATNILAVVVVIGIVAGAAWFNSQRSGAAPGESVNPSSPAPVLHAAQPPAEPAGTAAEGELCPEPVPTTQPAAAQAAESATAPPVDAKGPRLVDLGATSCKACKALAPILDALREQYQGRLDVEFIDVWKDPKAGEPYKMRSIPTQIFFAADGTQVWRHEGFLPKDEFIKKFTELGVK